MQLLICPSKCSFWYIIAICNNESYGQKRCPTVRNRESRDDGNWHQMIAWLMVLDSALRFHRIMPYASQGKRPA